MTDPHLGVRDLPTLARSIHCFRADPQHTNKPPPKATKAKLTADEKKKVLEVRRQGACLRCRMLKIQCSNENPCQSCLQSAVRGSERKVLSFCYCVRTRFADVNIFSSAETGVSFNNMQIETFMSRMSILLARIAEPASFSLDSEGAFNDTLTSWLTNPNISLPNGSIVGLCCSSLLSVQFHDESLSDDGLTTEFRRFLLATSLTHTGWRGRRGELKPRDLAAVGHVSGYRLIKRLDRVLTPQFLAKCGKESCQVLFLLVLGTILGIGYSASAQTESPSFPSETLTAEFQQSPTLWLAMKEHLCQMLAHHLIFLGSMLGIKLETQLEQLIIDTAAKRWNKMESFVWADALPPSKPDSPPTERSLNFGENPPYWEPTPSDPPPSTTLLIPLPLSDLPSYQPETLESWSQNPQSYLDMTDEPESYGTPSADLGPSPPTVRRKMDGLRSHTEPLSRRDGFGAHRRPREVKRRSMWLVRSFETGDGMVNVHARVRGGRGVFV
ncbi:hypothetical protein B0H67DRAFT_485823 [Lasiosphaeris hirsuta]|uniref:Zn(2)-C6 fungal-type domain-containing protein n=1 Tax=Lasiosphaeris hirsuta TaxID=260670 RepID=A0AA40DZ92_9PEZI|nr:hypothetical protein B0H67DRAFT_485823 [Lasiosphaeris hirsuta]